MSPGKTDVDVVLLLSNLGQQVPDLVRRVGNHIVDMARPSDGDILQLTASTFDFVVESGIPRGKETEPFPLDEFRNEPIERGVSSDFDAETFQFLSDLPRSCFRVRKKILRGKRQCMLVVIRQGALGPPFFLSCLHS